MLQKQDLQRRLEQIDGKGFKAYQDLRGDYDFLDFVLHVDKVQSDPFAPPSRIRVSLGQERAGFPLELFANRVRKTALEDYLTRSFARQCRSWSDQGSGTGNSGLVAIDRCGQEILERSSLEVSADEVQARFCIGLPARGRRIEGRQAARMFETSLPALVARVLVYAEHRPQEIKSHLDCCEDQHVLREQLQQRGLVAFVANGAVLPRQSGVSDAPMDADRAVPFASPPELECGFDLPHQGRIRGLGLPEGVTLITGGGYHGKSTLLRALERGVYNHVPGDGREGVVALNSGMKIRAEDGRSVSGVDIRPFINDLPFGADTAAFSSDNASGSTSQAANIIEALETGSELLFLDEDTSATNFMIRDSRMQQLVAKAHEPITPFVDQVRELYTGLGVSTVLVLGGSGDYLDAADTVIMLKEYRPLDVTDRAGQVIKQIPSTRSNEGGAALPRIGGRRFDPDSFRLGSRDKIRTKGLQTILFGREAIDLACLEQLTDQSQTRSIAEILRHLSRRLQQASLSELVDGVLKQMEDKGLDVLSPNPERPFGDLARPRKQEICAAINRFRNLRML